MVAGRELPVATSGGGPADADALRLVGAMSTPLARTSP
jgi:hypothetical protein